MRLLTPQCEDNSKLATTPGESSHGVPRWQWCRSQRHSHLLCGFMLAGIAMVWTSRLPSVAIAADDSRQGTSVGNVLPENKQDFHLFLLVGQSNMAGRGKVTEADRKPRPRVLMLSQDNQWVPAVDPMHFDKPAIVGVGLGRSFADVLAENNPNVTIGLIPCAVGGSAISTWEPGAYDKATKTHPWDDAIARAKVALEKGVLKGILWHQGEAEKTPEQADVHDEKLHALIARFRDTLQAPNVPFIAGQMGQFEERPWSQAKQKVDADHRALPDHVSHTGFVLSDGLSHKGDKVHFSSDSYREFGRRYARVYLQMTKSKPQ